MAWNKLLNLDAMKVPDPHSGVEENISSSITLGVIIVVVGVMLIIVLILVAILNS